MARFFFNRGSFTGRDPAAKWTLFWLGCGLCTFTYAEPLTAEQLVNSAYADGGLIATASTCRLPKETINQLIYLQKKTALDTATQHQLLFTAKDYDDFVVEGFQATMQSLQQHSAQDDALESVCESIAEKITQKLQSDASAKPNTSTK
jgi:hypothetical protein